MLDTLFWALTSVLPKKKWILMESKPDYSDNTGELFRHMISKGVNRKYRIVWLVDEYENRPQSMPEHVEVLPLTFITGLYGMNVILPFQERAWAFWGLMGFMAVVATGFYIYFRHRKMM